MTTKKNKFKDFDDKPDDNYYSMISTIGIWAIVISLFNYKSIPTNIMIASCTLILIIDNAARRYEVNKK